MKGVYLRFFMNELQKHQGILLYEWLLELAKKTGIKGGSVFRAIAGFGRNGVILEEHFFELASNVPVEVVFVIKREEALNFIKLIKKENVDLFYALSECECGRVGEA